MPHKGDSGGTYPSLTVSSSCYCEVLGHFYISMVSLLSQQNINSFPIDADGVPLSALRSMKRRAAVTACPTHNNISPATFTASSRWQRDKRRMQHILPKPGKLHVCLLLIAAFSSCGHCCDKAREPQQELFWSPSAAFHIGKSDAPASKLCTISLFDPFMRKSGVLDGTFARGLRYTKRFSHDELCGPRPPAWKIAFL